MTEKDKQELTEVINNALAAHRCNCPLGFDEDEARVLNNFAKALQQGQKTALKAVVTDTNVAWSSERLHRELAAEHAAMQRRRGSAHQN